MTAQPPYALQNASHGASIFRAAGFSPFLAAGGVMAPTEYAVTAQSTPNMSVVAAGGRAWIPGSQVSNVTGQTFSTQAGYFALNDAPVTVTIATANATNPRIDVVYVAVQDSFYSGSNNTAVIGVVTGTPAASPIAPAAPSNSLVLATVAVAANATSITNGNIAQTPTATLLAVTRGGIDPVLSTNATPGTYTGQYRDHPTYGPERWDGSTWKRVGTDSTLGDGFYSAAASQTVTASPGWTDLATVTATSSGGPCVVRWLGVLFNGNSGADRTGSFQVVCDATVLGTICPVSLPLANLPRATRAGTYPHTPAAGSHTWKLQGNGSAAASVVSDAASITVIEKLL